jgi:hypothetical protein
MCTVTRGQMRNSGMSYLLWHKCAWSSCLCFLYVKSNFTALTGIVGDGFLGVKEGKLH